MQWWQWLIVIGLAWFGAGLIAALLISAVFRRRFDLDDAKEAEAYLEGYRDGLERERKIHC